jgi:hypothetical protein
VQSGAVLLIILCYMRSQRQQACFVKRAAF